jgi:hypothetical protein
LRAGRAPDCRRGTLFDRLEAADPASALDDELQLLGIVVANQIDGSRQRSLLRAKIPISMFTGMFGLFFLKAELGCGP